MWASWTVAIGGPRLGAPDAAWDPSPLVLTIALVVLLHWVGVRLRIPVLLLALAGGLLLAPIVDAIGLSVAVTVGVMVLSFSLVAFRRMRSP